MNLDFCIIFCILDVCIIKKLCFPSEHLSQLSLLNYIGNNINILCTILEVLLRNYLLVTSELPIEGQGNQRCQNYSCWNSDDDGNVQCHRFITCRNYKTGVILQITMCEGLWCVYTALHRDRHWYRQINTESKWECVLVSVSVQYKYLHTILYNPFLVGLCISIGVG